MNTRLFVLTILAFGTLYGQTEADFHRTHGVGPADSGSLSGEEWRFTLVARLMSLPSPVTNAAVQLHGMGDEAAVDVLKIMTSKPALTLGEVRAALDVIHMAFEQPASILSSFNRKPMATLFLLRHLGSTVSDEAVIQRISSETKFVQAAAVPPASDGPKQ